VASAASAPTITVSDTAGNTFNPIGSQLAWNSNGSVTALFVAQNVAGNFSDAITRNDSAAVNGSRRDPAGFAEITDCKSGNGGRGADGKSLNAAAAVWFQRKDACHKT
jgi:hypothetical protein